MRPVTNLYGTLYCYIAQSVASNYDSMEGLLHDVNSTDPKIVHDHLLSELLQEVSFLASLDFSVDEKKVDEIFAVPHGMTSQATIISLYLRLLPGVLSDFLSCYWSPSGLSPKFSYIRSVYLSITYFLESNFKDPDEILPISGDISPLGDFLKELLDSQNVPIMNPSAELAEEAILNNAPLLLEACDFFGNPQSDSALENDRMIRLYLLLRNPKKYIGLRTAYDIEDIL